MAHMGPVYIRLGREKVETISSPDVPLTIGVAKQLRKGNDVTIAAIGIMVQEALLAADILADEGIQARVLNCASVKPLDETAILLAAKQTGALVTAEEHQVVGGLGGAVSEVLTSNHPVPLERVGVHDSFGESGKAQHLLDKYGLRAGNIAEAARQALLRKSL
jgi:transketolase